MVLLKNFTFLEFKAPFLVYFMRFNINMKTVKIQYNIFAECHWKLATSNQIDDILREFMQMLKRKTQSKNEK